MYMYVALWNILLVLKRFIDGFFFIFQVIGKKVLEEEVRFPVSIFRHITFDFTCVKTVYRTTNRHNLVMIGRALLMLRIQLYQMMSLGQLSVTD